MLLPRLGLVFLFVPMIACTKAFKIKSTPKASYSLSEIDPAIVGADEEIRWEVLDEIIRRSQLVTYNQPTCQMTAKQKSIVAAEEEMEPVFYNNASFRLSKPYPRLYVVDFNPHVIPRDGNSETRGHMIQKINKCLRRANRFLRGPSGEVILFRITGQAEVPRFRLIVEPQELRANTHYFYTQMPCTTILHEFLHRVGLVDEYREQLRILAANQPIYNCRAVGPNTSVMNDQSAAAAQLTGSKIASVHLPGFQPLDIPLNPIDFEEGDAEDLADLERRIVPIRSANRVTGPHTITFRENPSAQRSTILMGSHFRLITQPFCEQSNPLYFQCAINSQRTQYPGYTIDNFTRNNSDTGEPNCLPMPPACGNPSWVN